MILSHRLRAAASAGLDDSAYSGFFTSGASPLDFNTTAIANGLVEPPYGNSFIDHNLNRAWMANSFATTGGYLSKTWGSTVPTNINFYDCGTSSTTATTLPHQSSDSSHSFCDMTIGYLQDFTAVLIFCNSYQNRLFFYTYELSPSYLGYITVANTDGTTINPQSICYDGSHILFLQSNIHDTVFGIDMPASTLAINSTSNTVTTKNSKNINNSGNAGMMWMGDGVIFSRTDDKLEHIRFTGSGLTGGSTNYKSFPHYTGFDATGFGISYKWRQLVQVRRLDWFTFTTFNLWAE